MRKEDQTSAARFRLFGYDAKGKLVGEVTAKDADNHVDVSLAIRRRSGSNFKAEVNHQYEPEKESTVTTATA